MAKSPYEISLGMVMSSLDRSPAPLDCIEEPSECSLYTSCTQREIWQSVEDAMQGVLNSTTVGELADRQLRRANRGVYKV